MLDHKTRITIFTGAGISAESGLKTFRDSDGLWENYRIEDVATPQAWEKSPEMVQQFYNFRRKQVIEAQPNAAHQAIAELEKHFKNVRIITQNIDDLHERAGSKSVIHLHGEILKSRSTEDPSLIYDVQGDLNIGDKCELGSQLRPDIVWFGEMVPNMLPAEMFVQNADIFIVVGTSLNVYPAAGLLHIAHPSAQKYLIDPNPVAVGDVSNLEIIKAKASEGVPKLVNKLIESLSK